MATILDASRLHSSLLALSFVFAQRFGRGEVMSFAELGLSQEIIQSLNEQGYLEPTPVQASAIPAAIAGRDLIVSAQTGSGKTAAFVLPALQRFQNSVRNGHGPRMLILTPTRELARQVQDAAKIYAQHLKGIRCVCVLGGTPYGQQQRMLNRPFDILVATPGRLLDLLDRGGIRLDGVEVLVLDEADRMLDMGFSDDVRAIVGRTPSSRQTLLFSATVEGDLADLTAHIMRQPEHIQINSTKEQHVNIAQKVYFSDDVTHKKALLNSILCQVDVEQAIVFTATKGDADLLAGELEASGMSCAALHGDMRQRMRNRTLELVHNRKVRVLVATDIAARGLDVAGISHVINFDLPKVVEDYVHRIGRTGRGGRQGTAISLVSVRDRALLSRISQYIGHKIDTDTISGLEPRIRPSEPRAPGKRQWRSDESRSRQDRGSFNRQTPRDSYGQDSSWKARKERSTEGSPRPDRFERDRFERSDRFERTERPSYQGNGQRPQGAGAPSGQHRSHNQGTHAGQRPHSASARSRPSGDRPWTSPSSMYGGQAQRQERRSYSDSAYRGPAHQNTGSWGDDRPAYMQKPAEPVTKPIIRTKSRRFGKSYTTDAVQDTKD